jgi:Animal haem peroxidase
MKPNCYAKWFGRAVWLGILVNLSFAVPALFVPGAFAATLGPGALGTETAVWLRNTGMLLVVLSAFHAAVARDPLGAVAFARRAVFGRLLAAAFWAWLACSSDALGVLWWFFAADLALGLVCGFLLFRALAVEPPPEPKPWRRGTYDRVYAWIVRRLEAIGVLWYKLWPPLLGSIGTGGLRRALRANNLYTTPGDVPDTAANRTVPIPDAPPPQPAPQWDPAYRDSRSPDGSYNDLSEPAMGMTGMRFGRNVPLADAHPTVPPEGDPARGIPSPRAISTELLARRTGPGEPGFIPATALNLLAAAWIQFQNHGWFNHHIPTGMPIDATGAPVAHDPAAFIRIPLAPNDPWIAATGQTEMRIRRSAPDATRPGGAAYPPTYRNTESHWWDASQVYGADAARQHPLRLWTDGKLKVADRDGNPKLEAHADPETYLPLNPATPGMDLTGFHENYWVGLSVLHTLFAREHNFLCDQLKARSAAHLAGLTPPQADEWLFGKARLIVAGLMAKIHTVEWTPGILGNPRLRIDMDSNWWGVLGRWFKMHVGRVSASEALSGIIGSPAEHHAAPYALTEEFTAVYRLHPLVPDEIGLYALASGGRTGALNFTDTQGAATRAATVRLGMTDWMYALGKQHPGAITLRNYPETLRQFARTTGEKMDLATRDIARDRERGIPAYNRFRELLRMNPARSYEELVGPQHPQRADIIATLKRLYGDDGINRVDLMVGLFAEALPPGFGFSDTAFRIFILMASRRLKSDRFFTDDFRPEVYTPFGIDWLNEQTMEALIARHFPALAGRMRTDGKTFAPW